VLSLRTDRWFSPGTSVSSTNKTDLHDIFEILIVALNTINQTKPVCCLSFFDLRIMITALANSGQLPAPVRTTMFGSGYENYPEFAALVSSCSS
jgi:hypothetical protein